VRPLAVGELGDDGGQVALGEMLVQHHEQRQVITLGNAPRVGLAQQVNPLAAAR
jgi:hypothetical protein